MLTTDLYFFLSVFSIENKLAPYPSKVKSPNVAELGDLLSLTSAVIFVCSLPGHHTVQSIFTSSFSVLNFFERII